VAGVTAPVAPFGVYVHIPFCARRCDYCAFATWTDRHHLQSEYLRALRAEIERAALEPATSIFVGGGTPSLVDSSELAEVIRAVPRAEGAEVTVECNPDDITAQLLESLVAAGVNRVSIGVQSMVAHVLTSLGRWHDPAHVRDAVALVRTSGVLSWNVDLIYGAVGETVADWRMTVGETLDLQPPHVSAYGLTVESGTRLARDTDRHPDDDDLADKYEVADELFAAAGLLNYEVSNWSRPGHESRHNRLYWLQSDYRGIGCAAHSHAHGRRWWNVRTPEKYIAALNEGRSPEDGFEVLDHEQRRLEGLQLALRMREGVPAESLDLDGLDGLVTVADGTATLTRRGRLLANEVSLRLK
jgi:putative oxygen-independent coproporphyrinogen III oxidase